MRWHARHHGVSHLEYISRTWNTQHHGLASTRAPPSALSLYIPVPRLNERVELSDGEMRHHRRAHDLFAVVREEKFWGVSG